MGRLRVQLLGARSRYKKPCTALNGCKCLFSYALCVTMLTRNALTNSAHAAFATRTVLPEAEHRYTCWRKNRLLPAAKTCALSFFVRKFSLKQWMLSCILAAAPGCLEGCSAGCAHVSQQLLRQTCTPYNRSSLCRCPLICRAPPSTKPPHVSATRPLGTPTCYWQ